MNRDRIVIVVEEKGFKVVRTSRTGEPISVGHMDDWLTVIVFMQILRGNYSWRIRAPWSAAWS